MIASKKIHFILLLNILTCTVSINSIIVGQVNTSAKPVIVIVHGAWGGAWAFKKTDSILTEKGYKVYRPTLTGLGEKVHLANPEIGLTTHIDDVVNMILFEDLHNIILMGHSYGGMVVTGVADRIPERIKQLIYLDAFVPEDGESVEGIQGSFMDWLKPHMKNGFFNPFWVRPNQLLPHDVPHPIKTFTETIILKNKKRGDIPSAYILTVDKGRKAEDDDFAKNAERARKKNWQMFEMQADHNPQNSMPDKLVDVLMQIK